MKRQVKNTIPVYDIQTLADAQHLREEVTAEGFAHYLQRHPNLKFPHRHSFYHLVYFSKGSGTHSIDFETFKIVPGQIYFMIPGQVHSWHFKGAIDGYIINFSGSMLHPFPGETEQFPFLSGIPKHCVVQLKKSKQTIEQLLQKIVAEVEGKGLLSSELIRMGLLSLFIHTLRDQGPAPAKQAATADLLSHFRKLLAVHYAQRRLPKDYAAMLHVTPNHLNAVCNEMLGMSAGAVIRDRVLLEAKRMLAGTGLSIAEIAWQLSFKDNSYFTKFFRKYAGVTPEQFREDTKSINNGS